MIVAKLHYASKQGKNMLNLILPLERKTGTDLVTKVFKQDR